MTAGRKTELLRVVKFTFFSMSAGLIEMGAFALLHELTPWSYWPCYLLALALSVVWNFTLNRKFTFRSAANVPKAMGKALAYYLVFTPLSTLLGSFLSSLRAMDRVLKAEDKKKLPPAFNQHD